MHFYLLAKQEDIMGVFEELSHLPSDTFTSIMVKDNSGIMPAQYVRLSTELLTDVGLVDVLKKTTTIFAKGVKILKDLHESSTLI